MNKQEPIYQQILEYLEILVVQNRRIPEYQLPSENQLAQKFQSSRAPVKQALAKLEADGIIYRKKGKGTYIAGQSVLSPKRRTYKFCFLLPRFGGDFFSEILAGIKDVLQKHYDELHIIITDDSAEKEEKLLRSAMKDKFDGIFLFPAVDHTYNDALLELTLKQYPLVMVARSLPGLRLSCVYCDYYEQAYAGTQYLIQKGHRSIAMLPESGRVANCLAERIRGYRTCILERIGVSAINCEEVDFFYSTDVKADCYAAMERIMLRQPTAIITCNNALGFVSRYLQKRSLHTEVACFDRENKLDKNLQASVIVDQNPFEIGRQSAEQMYAMLEQNAPIRNIKIEHRILENK